jgi:hypothetical protein
LKQGRFEQIWPTTSASPACGLQEVLTQVETMDIEPLPGFKGVGNEERAGEA